jgi:hypothetical protein
VTGTYTGDGNDDRTISGVGFQPDIVIVHSDDIGEEASFRTADMPNGRSKNVTTGNSLGSNEIQSFTADGFVIGDDVDVNGNGETYYWVAMKAGANVEHGTYTGDGNDNRNITSVGFQPIWVITLGDGEDDFFRPGSYGGANSYSLDGTGGASNRIQGVLSNGFQVGSNNDVNNNGVDYYWIAFANTTSTAAGFYTGDNNDPRTISIHGIDPVFAWVKRSGTRASVWRTGAVPGDRSLRWGTAAPATNRIQSLISGGFTVGDSDYVNRNGQTYYYLALEP